MDNSNDNDEVMRRTLCISPEAKQKFLDALSQGHSIKLACEAGMFGRSAVYSWRREDPKFAEAWDAAFESGTDVLEDEARRRALEKSDVLMITLLKARRPQQYRERSTQELVGRDNLDQEHGPIQVRAGVSGLLKIVEGSFVEIKPDVIDVQDQDIIDVTRENGSDRASSEESGT